MMVPSLIDIAVRAYTVPRSQPEPELEAVADDGDAAANGKRRKRGRSTNLYLPQFHLDTETRVTPALELMIGAYRLCVWRGKRRKRLICLEESIIHADDLTGEEMEIVRRYWRSQLLDTAAVEPDIDATPVLRLRSESEIRRMLYRGAYSTAKARLSWSVRTSTSTSAGSRWTGHRPTAKSAAPAAGAGSRAGSRCACMRATSVTMVGARACFDRATSSNTCLRPRRSAAGARSSRIPRSTCASRGLR